MIEMKRNIDINEITDGKLYKSNDLAKVHCDDCKGCFSCCKGMGNSLVLDPYDIHMLSTGLGISFTEMIGKYIELNVVDGIILPNMAMKGEKCGEHETCNFLNDEGRCSIHEFSPGICRLFPLGRLYNDEGFDYILQINECAKENRSKMKIKNFLGINRLSEYENYITDWHFFIKDLGDGIREMLQNGEDEAAKNVNMMMLNNFFVKPYEGDFYEEYTQRRSI